MIQEIKNLNLLEKWHVIDSQSANDKCNSSIKFETESIKSSLSVYSDVFILVKRDIILNVGNNTHVAFINYAPSSS